MRTQLQLAIRIRHFGSSPSSFAASGNGKPLSVNIYISVLQRCDFQSKYFLRTCLLCQAVRVFAEVSMPEQACSHLSSSYLYLRSHFGVKISSTQSELFKTYTTTSTVLTDGYLLLSQPISMTHLFPRQL